MRSVAETAWLAVPVLAGLVVYATYLATHPLPAYGAGLYVQIADTIAGHGYALPETIYGYTTGGVPYAYPPLSFFAIAVVRDVAGVDAFTLSRLLPGLIVVATLVPYFFLAREFLSTSDRAAFATVLFAVAPPVLKWHLSAGGVTRAVAFLFLVTGAYAGVRLFRDGASAWLAPAVVLFALTVLTHPTYTVGYGLTYLLFYGAFDRSRDGLVRGAIVAVGGIAIASPWWITVARMHGIDVFFGAAGTHSGLGGGAVRIYDAFVHPLVTVNAITPFYVAAYAGMVYSLWRRRYVLPAWLVLSAYVIGKTRFQFLAGCMLVTVLVFDLAPVIGSHLEDAGLDTTVARDPRRAIALALVVLVTLPAVGVGVAYAGGMVEVSGDSPSQPSFVDQQDVAGMEWVEANTDESASFVVLGDAAEWFPQQTDRTSLIGPWGVEWTTPARYEEHLTRYKSISECEDAGCVTAHLASGGHRPDYLYVPTDEFTIRGERHRQSPAMKPSLVESDRYRVVYENEGVTILEVTGEFPETPASFGE